MPNKTEGRTKNRQTQRAAGESAERRGPATVVTKTPVQGTLSGTNLEAVIRPTSEITHGMVAAYAVDSNRLMIKLNVSAICRRLISFPADSPGFRSAVSMTMLAYHNHARLYVRYSTLRDVVDRIQGAPATPDVFQAIELGLGEEALSFEDWPYEYAG